MYGEISSSCYDISDTDNYKASWTDNDGGTYDVKNNIDGTDADPEGTSGTKSFGSYTWEASLDYVTPAEGDHYILLEDETAVYPDAYDLYFTLSDGAIETIYYIASDMTKVYVYASSDSDKTGAWFTTTGADANARLFEDTDGKYGEGGYYIDFSTAEITCDSGRVPVLTYSCDGCDRWAFGKDEDGEPDYDTAAIGAILYATLECTFHQIGSCVEKTSLTPKDADGNALWTDSERWATEDNAEGVFTFDIDRVEMAWVNLSTEDETTLTAGPTLATVYYITDDWADMFDSVYSEENGNAIQSSNNNALRLVRHVRRGGHGRGYRRDELLPVRICVQRRLGGRGAVSLLHRRFRDDDPVIPGIRGGAAGCPYEASPVSTRERTECNISV